MFKFYPVTPIDIKCEDYEIKINGVAVTPDTARVSANPINRRWPGHQRGLEQTELINFLSFATDEEVELEITPKESFKEVVVRPQSLGIKPEIKDGVIRFTLKKAAYFTVEPYGRSRALHIFADGIKEYKAEGEVIYFGAGEHDVGLIELKSNQTLFIDEGAVVYANIRAIDADNIKIIGRGILDNSRNREKILFEYNAEDNDVAIKNAKREHTVQIEYCTNVLIDGITVRDSLVYNIRPIGCENLEIRDVKIIGCWRYNSDGIDMHNCVNVLIDNCFLRTYDDSICVKGFDCYYDDDVEAAVKAAMYRGGKSYDVFKNVRVKNCVIWNDWGKCLEIGAETRAEEICDIVFEDCDIIHITAMPLDSYNIDYADVHDVTYRNINIEIDDILPCPMIQCNDCEVYENRDPDYCPETMCVITSYHHEYSAGGTRRGKTRNITFENIYVWGIHSPKAYFEGYDEEHKTEDITVRNIYHNGIKITDFDDKVFRKGRFVGKVSFE